MSSMSKVGWPRKNATLVPEKSALVMALRSKMCGSGKNDKCRSEGPNRNVGILRTIAHVDIKLQCVISAPLGGPVVPLVYEKVAMSFGDGGQCL